VSVIYIGVILQWDPGTFQRYTAITWRTYENLHVLKITLF